MRTNYDQQAADFLNKYGIEFKVKFKDNSCPPFCSGSQHVHGLKYKITLSRTLTQKKISFDFWNSYNDAKNKVEPTAYDVLTCCSSDISCPDKFEDFCYVFGYDSDSIKAKKTFNAVQRQSKKLNSLFDTPEMVEDLQKIE